MRGSDRSNEYNNKSNPTQCCPEDKIWEVKTHKITLFWSVIHPLTIYILITSHAQSNDVLNITTAIVYILLL